MSDKVLLPCVNNGDIKVKEFVIMSKRTGQLAIGFKLAFVVKEEPLERLQGYAFVLMPEDEFVWGMIQPDVCPVPLLASQKQVQNSFEILGEL